jgi:hypothetical protein
MTNVTFVVIALFTMTVPVPISAKRVDPPKEATPAQIAKVLRSANVVGVFCGQDIDFQTCTFFQKALSTALAGNNVTVLLSHLPEVLVQSFYVPPMQLPFTNVTIRLIEDKSAADGVTRLWMGGFGFEGSTYSNSFKKQQDDAVCEMIHDTSSDPSSPACPPPVNNDEGNVIGFQLPRWVEAEGVARDTGPLEADKVAAASSIVHEFIAYWKDAVKPSAKDGGSPPVAPR